jgi:hypothetical protein
VKTESWGLTYFRGNWDHYRVRYEASVELRDSHDQRVIAAGQCLSLPDDWTKAPSYEQMLGNQAYVLKKYLEDGAAFCSQKFFKDLFGLDLSLDRTPMPVSVDAQTLYASCHLEETPAWKAADPAGKHRMLEECWQQRHFRIPAPGQAAPAGAVKP